MAHNINNIGGIMQRFDKAYRLQFHQKLSYFQQMFIGHERVPLKLIYLEIAQRISLKGKSLVPSELVVINIGLR